MFLVRYILLMVSEKTSPFVPAERATKTFVGTAQYVSPELLEANETSKRYASDCSGTHKCSDVFSFE
jgi:serine/threonine protein kinase